MTSVLDPECPEATRLERHHSARSNLFTDGSAGTSRLGEIVGQARDRDYQAHAAECSRCWRYARTCRGCRRDLTRQRHAFGCRENASRWRNLWLDLRHVPVDAGPSEPPVAAAKPKAPRRASKPVAQRAPVGAPAKLGKKIRMAAGAEGGAHAEPEAPAPRASPSMPSHHEPPRAAPPPPPRRPERPESAAPPPPPPQPRREAPPEPEAPRAKPPSRRGGEPPFGDAEAYAVLGLSPGATRKEIQSAFKQLALQHHPDRVQALAPELRDEAEQRMRLINRAYDALRRHA